MGYMLPLRFIKVSNNPIVSICATRIVSLMSTDLHQARRAIRDERLKGTLINACGNNAAKTAIFLDNGVVVSSPITVKSIMKAIEQSNQKVKASPRLKVYDVYDEEPEPEEPEDIEELDVAEEDYDDFDDE